MAYPFRNLVFEGGGVTGIAYVGAMDVLARRRILPNITRVGGTSAGAINALLFALGYSNAETQRLLADLDFTTFLDDDWGAIRDTRRLLTTFGWYRCDAIHVWLRERIADKLGDARATFSHLQGAGRPDLYVYGTNLSNGFGQVYSAEHTPGMMLADAVRISMSIPLFFAAVRNARDEVLVDGGVLDNYPVKLFDRLCYIAPDDRAAAARDTEYYAGENAALEGAQAQHDAAECNRYVYNRQTLGLRLDTRDEIAAFRDGALPAGKRIDDFFDYAKALVTTVIEAQGNQHLHSDDWQRTLYIDSLGVGTTDFAIDADTQQALIESGRAGAETYLDWFNSRDAEPVNRC